MQHRWWLALLALVGWAVLVEGQASAAETPPPERTLSPYFFVHGGDPSVDQMPLRSTKVDVAISGVIASVTVTQVYENAGKRPIHAEYVFPASTRAAVNGLKMTIGKRVVVAKIREREAARREYEAAKEQGKNAALLEQQRPNVFTMQVSNVMPGDTIEVTLRYTELVVPTGGTYELVYPTVVGPRYSSVPEDGAKAKKQPESPFVATPFLREGEVPTSDFELSGTLSSAIPVQTLESPSHPLRTAWDNATLARFTLDGTKQNDRDVILRYALSGNAIQTGLSLHEGEEKTFMLLVQPPKSVRPKDVPAREYVFILDVSGSMDGFPLDTAKGLIREMAAKLRPVDRFNVILFAGGSHLHSPTSLPATPENVTAALEVIDNQRGGGGTELLPALEKALKLPTEGSLSRSFVIVTDGYIEADREAIATVRQHLSRANVFSFGIGSSVNRYLIEGLARAGEGEPFVVTDPTRARETALRFQAYVASPVLTHVKVAFGDGFDAYDVEPRELPDVLADRPIVVQGKWRGAPRGKISLTGSTAAGPYSQDFDVATVSPRSENHALPYLWARSRIAALSDFGFGEPDDARKKEITALGLSYELLTAYTSFIAVSHVVRTTADGVDVEQPSSLPAGVSELAVGGEMTGAPEPELLMLLAACAVLGGLLGLGRGVRRIGVVT